MPAPTIRVTPEILYSSSGDISSLGGQISSSVSELSRAVDGIRGAYDGQLEAAVGARVAQAQGAANNTTNRVNESSADLTRRASVFEAADNASMEDIVAGNGAVKDWTGTNLTFTQYGRLQAGATPMLANYLNLGNLSGAYDSPSAQLNPMVVPGNGSPSFQQGMFAWIGPAGRFFQGTFKTFEPVFQLGEEITGNKKYDVLADFIAEGKFNVPGFQRVAGGKLVEAGADFVIRKIAGKTVPGIGQAVLVVDLFTLEQKGELTIQDKSFDLQQKVGLLDPSETKLLHGDIDTAQKSLDKIDPDKVIKDLGAAILEPVATPIQETIDIWKNPTVQNIARLGHTLAGPQMDAVQTTLQAWKNPTPQNILNAQGHLVNAVINQPLSPSAMAQDPALQANVVKDLGAAVTDTKSLIQGTIEYPFDRMKLGVDQAAISISKVQKAVNGITAAVHQTLD